MKKFNARKGVSMALIVAMSLSVAACGSNGGTGGQGGIGGLFGGGSTNKVETDPNLAKQNVFSNTPLKVSLSGKDGFNIMGIGVVDGGYAILVDEYDYSADGQTTECIVIDENGNEKSRATILKPDVTYLRPDNYEELISVTGEDEDAEIGLKEGENGVFEEENPGVLFSEIATEEIIDGVGGLDDDFYVDSDGYYSESIESTYFENFYFQSLDITKDGIVGSCEYYNYYYDPSGDGYISNDYTFLCKWNFNGDNLWCVSINDAVDGMYPYLNGQCTLNNGDVLVVVSTDGKNQIISVSGSGEIKSNKAIPTTAGVNDISRLVAMKNGRVVAFYYDDKYKTNAAYFDTENLSFEDAVQLPSELENRGYNSLISGETSDFIVTNNEGIYTFNLGDVELTKLMDYINSDFEGYSVNSICMIDDKTFIGIYDDVEDYTPVVAKFTYVDPETIPDRKIITMASYYVATSVRKHIADFNKTNPEYRIMVRDYSKYATEDDYYAGVTNLNNEILAGNVPDIVCMNSYMIDFTPYAKKGLLVDFDELIAKDEELSKLEYLTNVFDAFGINGKHNVLVTSFSLQTYMANKSIVGDRTSWTIAEFLDFVKTLPEDTKLIEYCSRENFLSQFLAYNYDDFIDLSSGKCNLNSEEFIAMLEYSASFPSGEELYSDDAMYWNSYEDNYRSGKVVLYDEYLYNLSYIHNDNYVYFLGNSTLIGMPTMDGVSGVLNADETPFVIFNKGNVDGAWEFVRYFLTPECQDTYEYGIPILKSSFNNWIEKGKEPLYWVDEDGNKNYYMNSYYIDGVEMEIPHMTDAEAKVIADVICNCNKSAVYNDEIFQIIEEEASAFYSGQKTSKEVTDIMQSRISLYISENN